MQKYNIILADPPWHYNFKNRKGLSDEAKARLYNTMSGSEIKALPVNEIRAEDSVLFLWTINSELPLALEVMQAWGFEYKTVAFTWVKTTKRGVYHFGGGNWTRSNPELCLLGTHGHPHRVSASVRNLVVSPVREHSRKPDEVRDRIVELVGDLPRVELFARQRVEGWDSWGNEVRSDIWT
jgi:N6-adenosine-specific RNA methylase IME4